MYALRVKGKFEFICVSRSPKEFDTKVQAAYWAWRGLQPRGRGPEGEVFMSRYEAVIVNVELYSNQFADFN